MMVLKRPGEWQLTPTTPRGALSAAARPCACPRPVPNTGVGKGLISLEEFSRVLEEDRLAPLLQEVHGADGVHKLHAAQRTMTRVMEWLMRERS